MLTIIATINGGLNSQRYSYEMIETRRISVHVGPRAGPGTIMITSAAQWKSSYKRQQR
jgi:hypothetical protein